MAVRPVIGLGTGGVVVGGPTTNPVMSRGRRSVVGAQVCAQAVIPRLPPSRGRGSTGVCEIHSDAGGGALREADGEGAGVLLLLCEMWARKQTPVVCASVPLVLPWLSLMFARGWFLLSPGAGAQVRAQKQPQMRAETRVVLMRVRPRGAVVVVVIVRRRRRWRLREGTSTEAVEGGRASNAGDERVCARPIETETRAPGGRTHVRRRTLRRTDAEAEERGPRT
jgi:hypothetical protein